MLTLDDLRELLGDCRAALMARCCECSDPATYAVTWSIRSLPVCARHVELAKHYAAHDPVDSTDNPRVEDAPQPPLVARLEAMIKTITPAGAKLPEFLERVAEQGSRDEAEDEVPRTSLSVGVTTAGTVKVMFGEPVSWLSFHPEEVDALTAALANFAEQARAIVAKGGKA